MVPTWYVLATASREEGTEGGNVGEFCEIRKGGNSPESPKRSKERDRLPGEEGNMHQQLNFELDHGATKFSRYKRFQKDNHVIHKLGSTWERHWNVSVLK